MGNLPNLGIGIKSIEKHMLLAGGDDNQSKKLAYMTTLGAVNDYIQRYLTEYRENSWEQLKSELDVRFAEVNDPHHAFTMLCKARQVKMSLLRFMHRGCMLWQMMHMQK